MTHPSDSACLWCGHPFRARRTGSPKRFCSAAHRIEFWSALRRWAERAVAAGAEQLLKEFLVALLEEPSPFDEADEGDTLWSVIAAELPDELYERLTCWLMARSSGGG